MLSGIVTGTYRLGQLEGAGGEDARHMTLAAIAAAFEAQRCEVSRQGDRLEILMPGVDGAWSTPFESGVGRLFWDRVSIELQGGHAVYRLDYWTWWQLCIHVLITSLVALQYCFGAIDWSLPEYLGISLIGNLIPFTITTLLCHWQCRSALGQCRSALGQCRSALGQSNSDLCPSALEQVPTTEEAVDG